ncbi:MAG: hypothetical protein RRY72_00995 [Bacteroides sp.]
MSTEQRTRLHVFREVEKRLKEEVKLTEVLSNAETVIAKQLIHQLGNLVRESERIKAKNKKMLKKSNACFTHLFKLNRLPQGVVQRIAVHVTISF